MRYQLLGILDVGSFTINTRKRGDGEVSSCIRVGNTNKIYETTGRYARRLHRDTHHIAHMLYIKVGPFGHGFTRPEGTLTASGLEPCLRRKPDLASASLFTMTGASHHGSHRLSSNSSLAKSDCASSLVGSSSIFMNLFRSLGVRFDQSSSVDAESVGVLR